MLKALIDFKWDGGRNWSLTELREHELKEHESHAQDNRARIQQNNSTVQRNLARISQTDFALQALRKAHPRPLDAASAADHHERGVCMVLVADDDANDFWLVQYAFHELGLKHQLIRAEDGMEAMNYLRGAGEFGDRDRFPVPDLLLLDLEMPHMDGFAVLSALREEGGFSKPPVVVLSGLDDKGSRERALKLGASGFFGKPFAPQKMQKIVRTICDRWLSARCQRPEARAA